MPQQEGERERYANEDLHFLTDALVFLPMHPNTPRDGRGSEILKNVFRLAAGGFGSRIGPWVSSDEI